MCDLFSVQVNNLVSGMLGSIERHLRRRDYGQSVISNADFPKTKSALTAKQKELKSMGKGSKPKASTALSATDIDTLYDTNQLGSMTPASLINTLWYNNMTYFGMRSDTAHRAMMWGDAELQFDHDLNSEYVEFHERATKTRTGININDMRPCAPRMYASPEFPERCPVEVYKRYKSKRPEDYSEPTDPFYIAPVTHTKTPGPSQKWFLRQPVGINKIKELMKVMSRNAELPDNKHITNTSVRKTLVQRMTDCNVPDNLQVYVTGHKRPESLNNYRQLGNNHKKLISNLLTHNTAKAMPQATLKAPPCATLSSPPPNYTVPGYNNNLCRMPVSSTALPLAGPSSPVQNRSTLGVGIQSLSTDLALVPSQNQLTQSNTHSSLKTIFAGSTIHGNVSVTFNSTTQYGCKRRRIRVIDSDSE